MVLQSGYFACGNRTAPLHRVFQTFADKDLLELIANLWSEEIEKLKCKLNLHVVRILLACLRRKYIHVCVLRILQEMAKLSLIRRKSAQQRAASRINGRFCVWFSGHNYVHCMY